MNDKQLHNWKIGLWVALLISGYFLASSLVHTYMSVNKADRIATGYVVEVDPGEPGSYDGDGGTPPSSHYQFRVGPITYDGWIEDELEVGERVLVRYNSSNPKYNHLSGMAPRWLNDAVDFVFLVIFGYCVWRLIKIYRDPEHFF